MTLAQWERLIDTLVEQFEINPRLTCLKKATKSQVERYLDFYAIHGGLFTAEKDREIKGFMTVHPGKKDLDWIWDQKQDTFTVNMVWADSKKALSSLIFQALRCYPVKNWFACRDGRLTELNPKKVERILSYGK
jgi:hypothetical protein